MLELPRHRLRISLSHSVVRVLDEVLCRGTMRITIMQTIKNKMLQLTYGQRLYVGGSRLPGAHSTRVWPLLQPPVLNNPEITGYLSLHSERNPCEYVYTYVDRDGK